MSEDKEYIELEAVRAMIYIPENTIELEINATIYADGKIRKVGSKLNLQECRDAIRDAEMNYIEDDDLFGLTEKGRKYLEALNK